ncbi:hypothetical protein GRF59_07075 [Paenibacillus sp. HJL G12]|uniref:Uncharacterized protein n=1 Tax=Paenibacillus dendrobii TaxID=2691084 RepID=A0A7X3IGA2_9BACL|nr:hypothetical protein [Paenibacillus dendrobii]MWV43392.1 hypothetical protein [Paenibacillus dendrobii]
MKEFSFYTFTLISYNVVVFTTSHRLKAAKVPGAMRLVGADVSGQSSLKPLCRIEGACPPTLEQCVRRSYLSLIYFQISDLEPRHILVLFF